MRRLFLTIAFVVPVALLLFFSTRDRGPGSDGAGDGSIRLSPPAFVASTAAEGEAIASIFDDEAGMAAYFNAAKAINFDDIRPTFRTIEAETSTYLLGSVAVPDYASESEDVHVYVHKDGWFMAYYLAEDPAAKIVDWAKYDHEVNAVPTKFETVLTIVAAAAGTTPQSVGYYDFRYPNATNLLLIVEYAPNGPEDSFDVTLPIEFVYYERSWMLHCYPVPANGGGLNGSYDLNGERVISTDECSSKPNLRNFFGSFDALQLPPNSTNTITLDQYRTDALGGLAIVYRVP